MGTLPRTTNFHCESTGYGIYNENIPPITPEEVQYAVGAMKSLINKLANKKVHHFCFQMNVSCILNYSKFHPPTSIHSFEVYLSKCTFNSG